MSHLQTLTVGRANEAIRGFWCNSSMYQAALEELEHRFERPDIIVNSFFDTLRLSKRQVSQIQQRSWNFFTFVNNLVECFRHLGFESDLNSTNYTQIAGDMLSLNDRFCWNEYIVQNQIIRVTLFDFNRWLGQCALGLRSDAER